MFGWLNNYVGVGLPLMRAFSPEEFRAVVAHEFGHLSCTDRFRAGFIAYPAPSSLGRPIEAPRFVTESTRDASHNADILPTESVVLSYLTYNGQPSHRQSHRRSRWIVHLRTLIPTVALSR